MAVSEKDMMDMALNTKITIGSVEIQRVVGGWIYWEFEKRALETNEGSIPSCALAGVFVPENVSSPASVS